jgi:hypothetical protein
MVKRKGRSGEYELTIPFEDEDEIAGVISEIGWEVEMLAKLDDCFVWHEFEGVGE